LEDLAERHRTVFKRCVQATSVDQISGDRSLHQLRGKLVEVLRVGHRSLMRSFVHSGFFARQA